MESVNKVIVETVDGKRYPTDHKGAFNPGGDSAGEPELHGEILIHDESEVAATLTTNLLLVNGVDIDEVNRIRGAVAVIETNTGVRYMLREAYTIGLVEYDPSGKAAWRIGGIAERM